MNNVVDLEIVVLCKAVKRRAITDPRRIERIKESALDELEFSTQTAEHRDELESVLRDLGIL